VFVGLDRCRSEITGSTEIKGKRACIDFAIKGTNKILCIEVDEHAHEYYDAVCELTRMQQAVWGIHGGDNLESHWIRFNPHLLASDMHPSHYCFKERIQVLLQCIMDVLKQEVDEDGAKGPFVTYLFYGDNSKNIAEHVGKEDSISIVRQINSIDEIDISDFVSDFDDDFSNIRTDEINHAIDVNMDKKMWGSIPQCDANSLQNVKKKRKKAIPRCSARAKSFDEIDGRTVGLCEVHFKVYEKFNKIDLHSIEGNFTYTKSTHFVSLVSTLLYNLLQSPIGQTSQRIDVQEVTAITGKTGELGKGKLKTGFKSVQQINSSLPSSNDDTNQLSNKKARYESPTITRSNVTLSTSTPPSGNVSVQHFSRLQPRSPRSLSPRSPRSEEPAITGTTGVLGKGKLKTGFTNPSPSSNDDTNQLSNKKARYESPPSNNDDTNQSSNKKARYESPTITRSNVTLSASTPSSGNVSVQHFSRLQPRSPRSPSQHLTVIKKVEIQIIVPDVDF
jgi:hypothetical protein